jgi:hypothetical protein
LNWFDLKKNSKIIGKVWYTTQKISAKKAQKAQIWAEKQAQLIEKILLGYILS